MAQYALPGTVLSQSIVQLSDGSLVWAGYTGTAGTLYLYRTADRSTITQIASIYPTALNEGTNQFNVSLCCDASDNIYVAGWLSCASPQYDYLNITALVKQTGSWTWTTTAWHGVNSCTNFNGGWIGTAPIAWCNTGGGTNGAGHVVLGYAYGTSSDAAQYCFVGSFDAGGLLAGTYTNVSSIETATTSYTGSWPNTYLGQDSFGSTNLLYAGPSGSYDTSSYFNASYISISSTGALGSTVLSAGVNTQCNGIVGVASGVWVILCNNGTYPQAIRATTSTLSSIVTRAVAMPGETGGSNYWQPFADPTTANRAWLIGTTNANGNGNVYRISCNVGSGTPVWDASWTADTTLTGIPGSTAPLIYEAVAQPRTASYVDWLVNNLTIGDYSTFASAPNAPTLTAPASNLYVDATQSITFTATYNSTDGADQNAYALRITLAGVDQYWNATSGALQSSIVWNTVLTTPGSSWSVTLPANTLANGNAYDWSMASQESTSNLQGPFATDFVLNTQAAPVIVVTGPSGNVTNTQPNVTWSLISGTQQTYEIIVEDGAYGTVPGSGTQVWTSGVVSSTTTSVQIGTPLLVGTTYRVFVQVGNNGDNSTWAYSTITVIAYTPAITNAPAARWQAPTPGQPTLAGHVNQFLAAHQSSAIWSTSVVNTDPTPSATTDYLGGRALAQKFTVSTPVDLRYVHLALGAIGSGQDVLVTLQADSAGAPSGTPLAAAVVPAEWLPAGAWTSASAYMVPLAYTLAASTTYYIVLQPACQLAAGGALSGALWGAVANVDDVQLAQVPSAGTALIYSGGTWTAQTYGYGVYLRGGTTDGVLYGLADDPLSGYWNLPSKITSYYYNGVYVITNMFEWVLRSFNAPVNMLSRNDAALVNGLGSLSAGANTSIARTTSQYLYGNAALELTATASGSVAAQTGYVYPVTAGDTYSASAYFKAVASARSCTVAIGWYTSAGVYISGSTGTAITNSTTEWLQASVTAQAPATAGLAFVQPAIAGCAASEQQLVDCLYLGAGTNVIWSLPGVGVASARTLSYSGSNLTSLS